MLPGVDDRGRVEVRPGQVEGRRCRRRHGLEDEGSHHAEVAARATQGPEQVRLAVLVAPDDAAVRQHHPRGEQAVGGEPVFVEHVVDPA
jgi:hypothetical protein